MITIQAEAEEIDYDMLHRYRGQLVYRSPSKQDACVTHGPYIVSVVADDVWLIRGDEKIEAKTICQNAFFVLTGGAR